MQSSLARQGKFDVRRDEEQNVKLNQITKLLIDAGYFRARIKGLSPFDKIVGGMTWCIELCNFDIDVDLLFHDNLTIGQKISLTERIVNVLPQMKCPHRIEPHQIQGLDSIHIFPVIQWLVKLAVETRAEYHDDTRVIALDEFNRHYSSCFPQLPIDEVQRRIKFMKHIKLKYGPRRRFKMERTTENKNERILTTLLEYSDSHGTPQLRPDSDEESEEEIDKELQDELSKQMILEDNPHALFSVTADEISSIKSRKELSKKDNLDIEDHVSLLQENISEIKTKLEVKIEIVKKFESNERKLEDELSEKRNALQVLMQEKKKLDSINSDKSKLEEIADLIEENEIAKKKASAFKEKCRLEAEVLSQKISELKQCLEEPDDIVDQSLIDARNSEADRLSKLRNEVGKKSREAESLKRIIDDVPGRAEISQYQRRFIELYNQVRGKHHETLQFYNLYNTLADSRSYMEKELALLNSILDNMDQGLANPSSIEEYLEQLEGIIDGIKQNKIKLEKKKSETKIQRSSLSAELNHLQELQLLYARMLHQFSQEIVKNETLLDTVEAVD